MSPAAVSASLRPPATSPSRCRHTAKRNLARACSGFLLSMARRASSARPHSPRRASADVSGDSLDDKLVLGGLGLVAGLHRELRYVPAKVAGFSHRPGAHPAADPLGVAADLKRWHGHGATSYTAETSDSWVNGGAGHYLAARVLWDVRADPGKELDAYYTGAFGPAAGEVRALHEDWVRFARGKVLPKIARGSAAKWHHLIATADRKVGESAAYKARLNDVKRYYLYLDHIRVFDLDARLPGAPTREERLLRLTRYVGSNRGEGAFHAPGLLPTWLVYMPPAGVKIDPANMGPEFARLTADISDEKAWRAFPPLTAAEVDRRFAAARLPLDGYAADPAALDPAVHLFPAKAEPPAEITFPKLHGPPTPGEPRRYVLKVVAPTPKLTLHVTAGNPLGGGTDRRTCTVTGDDGEELKHVEFKVGEPVTFELHHVRPGVYTALFPDFGAEQVTVRGGNTFGAVRADDGDWGFNPFRPPT